MEQLDTMTNIIILEPASKGHSLETYGEDMELESFLSYHIAFYTVHSLMQLIK